MLNPRSWLRLLAAIHDGITRTGYYLAGAGLVLIVLSYCYEVVARYAFSSPTIWASSLVAYLLCAVVFLVIPELSRDRTHITITIVLDLMSEERARFFSRCAYAIAAIACLVAAWFCLDATIKQYVRNIGTLNAWRIPKWPLMALITYGLFSTSIHYLRHLFTSDVPADSEAVKL